MTAPAIAGIILSGGASSRMGFPKALLTYQGETFLDRLIRLLSTACAPVAVVLGEHAERIRSGTSRLGESVTVVVNPAPDRGMLSSLQCGLGTLPTATDAVLFTPVDYPSITQSTVSAVVEAHRQQDPPLTIPTYQGKRGHPVCISRRVARELLALPANAQARDVIRSHYSATCFLAVEDPGILLDVDVPAEYRALTEAL